MAAPRAASAANTAYVFAYFTETPNMAGASATDRQDATFRVLQ